MDSTGTPDATVLGPGPRTSSGEEKTALERLKDGEGYRSEDIDLVGSSEAKPSATHLRTDGRETSGAVVHRFDSSTYLPTVGDTKSAESSPVLRARSKPSVASAAEVSATATATRISPYDDTFDSVTSTCSLDAKHSSNNEATSDENEAHNLQHPPILSATRRGTYSRGKRIYPAGNRTSKWVTREIAALDFLTGLRIHNEEAIRARGTHGYARGGQAGDIDGLLGSIGYGWQSPQAQRGNAQNLGNAPLSTAATAHRAMNDADTTAATTARNGRLYLDLGQQNAKGSTADDDDDSDSDGGWLDQPLPHSTPVRRGTKAVRRRGTPAARGSAVGGAASSGGGRLSGAGSPAPARRLRGREAAHIRVPLTFRHQMQRLPGHGAAVVRQWEQGLTKQERLLEGRMFFSCSKGYPVMVSSVLHYQPEEEEARRVRQKWIDERGAEAFQIPKRDWRGYSYAHLLRPPHHRNGTSGTISPDGLSGDMGGSVGGGGGGGGGPSLDHSDGEGGGGDGAGVDGSGEAPYTAGFLDDPAMTLGRHRHMTRGDQNTGPVVSSLLLFVKPRVLKDELNAQFREKHANLPPSLTLSKIRSVKRQALLGCHRAGMEVATVALACVYFERLCLAGVVTKPNRRLTMATCLVIAYKFNEPVLMEGISKLPALWAFVDQEWTVSKKRVLEAEFGVLVQLSFNLHEDPRDTFHHFVLLLKMIESHASLYLGEEMIALHQQSLEMFFRDERGGGVDDDSGDGRGAGGEGSAGESPRGKAASDSVNLIGDARPRTMSSQDSPAWMDRGGWLQRRPTSNASRWLAAWRGSEEADAAARAVPGQVRHVGEVGINLAGPQPGKPAGSRLERLKQVGQGLGKDTRQRRQRLNKNVRDGATLLARRVSSRRHSRRKMET